MIEVKIKRQTKDKMDEHLQSHSPAQLPTDKCHSLSFFGNLNFQAPPVIPYLVDAPMPDCLSFNLSLGGAFTFYTSALWTATKVPKTWRHPALTSHFAFTPLQHNRLVVNCTDVMGQSDLKQIIVVTPIINISQVPVYSKLKI